jgi:hypothetical protein
VINFVLKMVEELALVNVHSNSNGGSLRILHDHARL